MSEQGAFKALASALLERWGLAKRAGLAFGVKRDMFGALGYPDTIQPEDYRAMYQRNAMAARIVEAIPKATWRTGGEVYEDSDPNKLTTFEREWQTLNQKFNLWNVFQTADILAGLGRYSVILIGAPGQMDMPLEKCKAGDIAYISCFSEQDARITLLEQDKTSPRYGLPVLYALRRTQVQDVNSVNAPTFDTPVHHTRCIHVAENLLDSRVYGIPRLERIWNLLFDLLKVTGGGAEAFWKRADAGMQINLDPMIPLNPDPVQEAASRQALKDQIEEYTHGLKRVVTTRGVEMTPLSSNVADFKGPADAITDQISAGTGIPRRILMGSERGELASSQDRDNWSERVSDRRGDYAGPFIARPFIDRCINLGALSTPKEYDIEWPEIEELTEGQKLTMAGQAAALNQTMKTTVITVSEIRTKFLGLEVLTQEQLDEAAGIVTLDEPLVPGETAIDDMNPAELDKTDGTQTPAEPGTL